MEITSEDLNRVELITVRGRVDSAEAVRFQGALNAANRRGKYRLVIDLSQLEYMSSAGFRALAAAQRNIQRHRDGELILTQLPVSVHQALEVVGFTEHFRIIDPLSAALEYAQGSPAAS
jgi:anti-sigma B factor antagonist